MSLQEHSCLTEDIEKQVTYLKYLGSAYPDLNLRFTILPTCNLDSILKNVKRKRKKEEEEKKWQKYLEEKEGNLNREFHRKAYLSYSEKYFVPFEDNCTTRYQEMNNSCSINNCNNTNWTDTNPVFIRNSDYNCNKYNTHQATIVQCQCSNMMNEDCCQGASTVVSSVGNPGYGYVESTIPSHDHNYILEQQNNMLEEHVFFPELQQPDNQRQYQNGGWEELPPGFVHQEQRQQGYMSQRLSLEDGHPLERCALNSELTSAPPSSFRRDSPDDIRMTQSSFEIPSCYQSQEKSMVPQEQINTQDGHSDDPEGSVKSGKTQTYKASRSFLGPEDVVQANDVEECRSKESLCKDIAKQIQEIPGVDMELRRTEDIRIKMMPVLLNIKEILSKPNNNANNISAGDEDLDRIRQRTVEFVARFKRNYMYRIRCQVNELKEIVTYPMTVSKKSKIVVIIQKLTTAHQGGIQGLQVIEKQLATISILGASHQLICTFYSALYELSLMLKPFYGYLKAQVLDNVETMLRDTLTILQGVHTDIKLETVVPRAPKKKTPSEKMSFKFPWMKKSVALARIKFGPPSNIRKKTAEVKNDKLSSSEKPSVKDEKGGGVIEEHPVGKTMNYMMTVKQRPGATTRRANLDLPPTHEPTTMVEMISAVGSTDDDCRSSRICQENISAAEKKDFDTVLDSSTTLNMQRLSAILSSLESVEKEPKPPVNEPKNVKLECVERVEDEEDQLTAQGEKEPNEADSLKWLNLQNYKHSFKKYKKKNPWYEKKTVTAIMSMSEHFVDETIEEVVDKITSCDINQFINEYLSDEIKDLVNNEIF